MVFCVKKSTENSAVVPRVLAVSLLTVATAACSTDVTRFSYVTREPAASTASIPEHSRTEAAPLDNVRTEPLSPVASERYEPAPVARNSYAPPRPVTPQGGARTVVVEQGDSVHELSRRYDVSVAEIAAANNLRWPYNVQVGQRLNIPAAGAPRTAWNKPAAGSTSIAKNVPGPAPRNPAFAPRRASSDGVHVVRSGDTVYSISRAHGMTPSELARLNSLDSSSVIKVGQRLRVSDKVAAAPVRKPATKTRLSTAPRKSTAKRVQTARYNPPLPRQRPSVTQSRTAGKSIAPARKPARVAKAQPRTKPVAHKVQTARKPAARKVTRVVERTRYAPQSSVSFRWPVKGRVISDYGRKANGARNDGINFAVPEGASVKSAAHGVVAYAGNELKGYGNLILIRHSDDWVTAYAHNSRLLVKRGQKVRRGEIIAKAGQTGSVDRPQLHFEVRKGAQAVDPRKYLGNSV